MQTALVTIALLVLAAGLRLTRVRMAKKLGAFIFLLAMAFLGWQIASHWIGAVISVGIWFLIPIIEILYSKRRARYPLKPTPVDSVPEVEEEFFPHATSYREQLAELGFEELDNLSWNWLEATQHHRFYWNPELNTVASVCLCELERLAFTFVIFHSELADGTVLRTTNYPFTSPLLHPPKTHWKHVACEEKFVPSILKSHKSLIDKHNSKTCSLMIPDPETVREKWTQEYIERFQYNEKKGIITQNNNHFRYTSYGYFYLWVQAVKDFIRLC